MARRSIGEKERPLVNKNVDFIGAKGSWAMYMVLVAMLWAACAAVMEPGTAIVCTHISHAVITFFLLHWVKGTPIPGDQGKYNQLTLWEQVDEGVQGTPNRKFATVVPALLFAAAIPAAGNGVLLIPTVVAGVVVIVAKMPAMYRVRIFGINRY
ncbi:unnamed protein product [Pedinophyceae sp. YPF-701]|nr:unnamed protein product [Pedinophyceae sp. YPF-701]